MAKKRDSPATAIDWTQIRRAAAILAAANIAIFSLETWKTASDKARVATFMHRLGAQAWPYPAYHPNYPFGYVVLPDGGFAIYQTTPDYLPVYLASLLLISIVLTTAGLARRPGRLRALWPVTLFTLAAGLVVVSNAQNPIQPQDLLEASISPATRTITAATTQTLSLCKPIIAVIQGAAAARSGPDYTVYLGTIADTGSYLASFPYQETALAFATLVAAKARQAGCGTAMQVIHKD